MKIHRFEAAPPTAIGEQLSAFEAQFSYPLGQGRSFRISHGDDYPRFFRSMGRSALFVAERNARVCGAVSVAIRPVIGPDGSECPSAYVGDLKVAPECRGTLVFPRLAVAGILWARPQVGSAHAVVMDGTRDTPADYTGRVGIPAFAEVAKLLVLRIAIRHRQQSVERSSWEALQDAGNACLRSLGRGRYLSSVSGSPAERSELPPTWLIHPNQSACGRLEDTRRGKRLIDSNGNEMVSAHLANFCWWNTADAVELLHVALARARDAGFPALFFAIDLRDFADLEPAIRPLEPVIAPATIYGVGFEADARWTLSSSEI